VLDLFPKRRRSSFEEDVSSSKTRYRLSAVTVPKQRVDASVSTPQLTTLPKLSTTPASAPAAAGRSPTKPRRQDPLPSRQRFAPPSFGTRSPALSITRALSGTLANKKAKKIRTIEDCKPKSWFFDIFEESGEQQEYRMNEWTMTQSAYGLDISDDESKVQERVDRGKENIDPNEVSVPVTRSMAAAAAAKASTQKDVMTDVQRIPLADLNPAEFYADGLDATSVVLVQDHSDDLVATPNTTEMSRKSDFGVGHEFVFEAPTRSEARNSLSTADLGSLIMSCTPGPDPEPEAEAQSEPLSEARPAVEIEIWESESAKDENERAESNDGDLTLQEL